MNDSPLIKAFASVDRSYQASKASVGEAVSSLLAQGPSGFAGHRSDLSDAKEQLRHFRGWVYAAIRPIAQRIAGQPICVGKAKRPGMRKMHQLDLEPFQSHPLLDLFADPNELMVSWSLKFSTVASLLLTGRCLWWMPDRSKIFPIPTSWIVRIEGGSRYATFFIRPPNTAQEFGLPSEDCCYFVLPNPADLHGCCSPLQAAAGAVDADEMIVRSQIQAFKNGIHSNHAVIVGRDPHPDVRGGLRPRLSASQQNQIVSAIRKRYAGVFNSGEPLILDGLIEDVKRLSSTPSEMDWMNSSKLVKNRILQIFGVNAAIIGELENSNRAAATVAEQHFISITINPLIRLLSETLTAWMRPKFEGEIHVWIPDCVAHDGEMDLRKLELAAKFGGVSLNELREFAGLPSNELFDGLFTGGRSTGIASSLDDAISQAVNHNLAAMEANRIDNLIRSPSRNGKH